MPTRSCCWKNSSAAGWGASSCSRRRPPIREPPQLSSDMRVGIEFKLPLRHLDRTIPVARKKSAQVVQARMSLQIKM